ncbi:hypothetical protein CsSME_00021843 [Camellia sinensis var. sinensis]
MFQPRKVGGLVPLGPLLKQFSNPNIVSRAILSCLSEGTLENSNSSLFRSSQGCGIKRVVPIGVQAKDNNNIFKGWGYLP